MHWQWYGSPLSRYSLGMPWYEVRITSGSKSSAATPAAMLLASAAT
jgi:hypothetical protein